MKYRTTILLSFTTTKPWLGISFPNLNTNYKAFSRDLSCSWPYDDSNNQCSNSKYNNEYAHLLSGSLLVVRCSWQLLVCLLHMYICIFHIGFYAVYHITLFMNHHSQIFENFIDVHNISFKLPNGRFPLLNKTEVIFCNFFILHLCLRLTVPRDKCSFFVVIFWSPTLHDQCLKTQIKHYSPEKGTVSISIRSQY